MPRKRVLQVERRYGWLSRSGVAQITFATDVAIIPSQSTRKFPQHATNHSA